MPKLKKLGSYTPRGLRASNGLESVTDARTGTSVPWSPALAISAQEAPSIFHEPNLNRSGQMVVWSGRGPLTVWPERDWSYILRTQGFDLIWDRPPLTSSVLWTRWMGRNGHSIYTNDDNFRWAKTETPKTWDEDRKKKFDQAWAKIAPLMEKAEADQQSSPSKQVMVKEFRVLSAEEAERQQRAAVFVLAPAVTCAHSGKIKHKWKLWALQHKLRLMQMQDETQPERLEVYKCSWCVGWHVGHRN